jgi:hypothetical protein
MTTAKPIWRPKSQKTPSTVLAVADSCWLVASERDQRSASVEMAGFENTLFPELTSILLSGQLKIYFAIHGGLAAAAVKFDTSVSSTISRQFI